MAGRPVRARVLPRRAAPRPGRRPARGRHRMSRRVVDALRHPWWAIDRIAREAAARFNRSGAGAVRDAIRRASTGRIEFRNRPMRREPDTDAAIRWLGPLASGSDVHTALFAHPDATINY